jgi:hypothetical protein
MWPSVLTTRMVEQGYKENNDPIGSFMVDPGWKQVPMGKTHGEQTVMKQSFV